MKLSEPQLNAQQFFALLERQAGEVRAVRALRRAWVQPAVGEPYLAIGLELYESSPPAVEAVRALMQRAIAVAPEGLAVSTVAMADEYDPVALWMRAHARPFFDREAAGRRPVPTRRCRPRRTRRSRGRGTATPPARPRRAGPGSSRSSRGPDTPDDRSKISSPKPT